MWPSLRRLVALAAPTTVTLAAAARVVLAHDVWIEPSAFKAEPGQRIGVGLRVGMEFKGDPVPRNPERIEKLVLVSGDEEIPVPGEDGKDPAGSVSVPGPGVHVLVYRSRPAAIELPPDEFRSYLEEEGLERILELRAKRGQAEKPAREVYSRCAKALVASGAKVPEGYDRVVGLPLELVPEANPFRLGETRELPVRLLFEGKPLAEALVVAMDRGSPQRKVAGRTGPDGRVRLPLGRPGPWLVKAVHMVEAAEGKGADWESFWASLTFEAD